MYFAGFLVLFFISNSYIPASPGLILSTSNIFNSSCWLHTSTVSLIVNFPSSSSTVDGTLLDSWVFELLFDTTTFEVTVPLPLLLTFTFELTLLVTLLVTFEFEVILLFILELDVMLLFELLSILLFEFTWVLLFELW